MEGFEGPEKRLEVRFRRSASTPEGFRVVTRAQLDEMCALVNCTILSVCSNEQLDAYVLSESSLFVYQEKVVLKTCGTTTLLRCLPFMLELASRLAMEVTFVCYSRRNFLYPERQLHPHCSFEQEVEVLNESFSGDAYILGPLTGAHWHVYVADMRSLTEKALEAAPKTRMFEMMMTGLDAGKMNQFYRTEDMKGSVEDGSALARPITVSSGLADVFSGATTDEYLFDPCGYSMNGIRGDDYATVHVTPEPQCSFVSYETTCVDSTPPELMKQLTHAFAPREFTVIVMEDGDGMAATTSAPSLPGYGMVYRSSYCAQGQTLHAVSYRRINFATR